jgi:type IV pilus assembly protein PilB
MVKSGVVKAEKARYAQRVWKKLDGGKTLSGVLVDLGLADKAALRRVVRNGEAQLRIGELLVEFGLVSAGDVQAALRVQKELEHSKKLGEILLARQLISETRLYECLADQLNLDLVEIKLSDVDPSILKETSSNWCRSHKILPLRKVEGKILIAFADPIDPEARKAVADRYGDDWIQAIASRTNIETATAAYAADARSAVDVEHDKSQSIVEIVDSLIVDAVADGGSDIHIEPLRNELQVRIRRDGVLVTHRTFPKQLANAVSTRLKVMAAADVAEKRRHQGGRIVFECTESGTSLDIRASFYSTVHGEKVVLRLLSQKADLLDIDDLGLFPRVRERFFDDVLDVPSGVILVTGPTGSGKTTTLYGCVNYLNTPERSITTAEDPVEYVVEGVAQCSLNAKIGVTFEETLRHMVRQDPDVIVLGEIRDGFSAEAAIQAALTGHKVMTTFHTEDTIGGLLRLLNMNIEAFLISSTVVSVLAQRLLRRICGNCSTPQAPSAKQLRRLGARMEDLNGGEYSVGRGCEKCDYSGYRGRVGVFELLVLNETVKDAILNRKSSYEIRRCSIETSGLVTLVEDGLLKAAMGKTSLDEVLRHLPKLERPRPLIELQRLVGV